MLFTPLPSIPSLYKTTEMCSTDLEATKSNSSKDFITAKASAKAESVSTILWHRSVTVSQPHLTQLQIYVQQKSPPNMMTSSRHSANPSSSIPSFTTHVFLSSKGHPYHSQPSNHIPLLALPCLLSPPSTSCLTFPGPLAYFPPLVLFPHPP
jgi:hypothetical protein